MKLWLIVGLFMALTCTMAYADYTCVNYSHSEFSTIINIGNNSLPVSYNESCQFNCTNMTGMCNESDLTSSTLSGIALLFISALFIVAAIKSSSGFVFRGLSIEFLQPLFFTFAFLLILTSISIMITGSKASEATYGILSSSYSTTMWVFIFFISFMVISFIVNILTHHLDKASKGKS